ncbi:ABC transporter substrate-binding protein [uncultured Tateyamaria sp.]|uniref:ABC transporter substrate-binding protein n=1 Tax=uncultured Tateyamaria sp. TaxID=455651 RepID=UPI00260AC273|nr:ABC transporter substrate-binding protein [uncultured Tateyamaria sp.]
MKLFITAAVLTITATAAFAAGHCAAGKTLTDGTLTIATGNPAYYPWVIDDAPESKQGFEAAVAYALAGEMGFSDDAVTWVRTSFDEAIQPGEKNFDINMQQFSITEERDKVVDFSAPYYTAPQAVMTTVEVAEGGAKPTLDSLKTLKWGVVASTTALPIVMETIAPDQSPLVYDDNANVTAAIKAGQIDAALFDLPTALFTAAVLLDNGVVLGQFDPEAAENPDQFGMLMTEGNPLKECVDEALTALTDSGKLAEIEAEWLQQATGVPLIK